MDAQDDLVKAAGSIEILDQLLEAGESTSNAGLAENLDQALANVINFLSNKGLTLQNNESTAQQAKDLVTFLSNQHFGYRIWTRIQYETCCGGWFHNSWGNPQTTPPTQYIPKMGGPGAGGHGNNGYGNSDGNGLWFDEKDAYRAAGAACYQALKTWKKANAATYVGNLEN